MQGWITQGLLCPLPLDLGGKPRDILNPQLDDSSRFATSDWKVIHQDDDITLIGSNKETHQVSLMETPTLLVIGDASGSVYHEVFRLANEGLATYDEFLIVDGSKNIDEFALSELSQFDVILLHGYQYRDAAKAWTLLGDYVRGGGSLFIDTGWQYKIPHWEFEQAPDVLPVDRLAWTSYGKEDTFSLDTQIIRSEIDVDELAPLVWEDHPWGVSGAEIGSVRDWAIPVLSAQGRPLMLAGEYGQGRVVWSGMNLISHINAYANDQEKALLGDLISWLAEGTERKELAAPEILRSSPDEIRFNMDTATHGSSWLLWRESYYPSWRASWTSDDEQTPVPVYRAGPGLMLLPVPASAGEGILTLAWQPNIWEKAGLLATFAGIAGLFAFSIDGLVFKGEGFTWIKIALLVRIPRPFLGEGPNTEWAERKREELVTGYSEVESETVAVDVSTDASNETDMAKPTEAQGFSINLAPDEELDADYPESVAEDSLLQSWLDGTGHDEDAWAEKLLGRRHHSKERQGEE